MKINSKMELLECYVQIMFELIKIVGTLEYVGPIFLVERNEYFNF